MTVSFSWHWRLLDVIRLLSHDLVFLAVIWSILRLGMEIHVICLETFTRNQHTLSVFWRPGGGGPAEHRRRGELGRWPQQSERRLHGESGRGEVLAEALLSPAVRHGGVSVCGQCVRREAEPQPVHGGDAHPEVRGSHGQPEDQRWAAVLVFSVCTVSATDEVCVCVCVCVREDKRVLTQGFDKSKSVLPDLV